jgi:hypothetical protein
MHLVKVRFRLKKTTKDSVRITDVAIEVRFEHLPITSLVRYSYPNVVYTTCF